MSVFHRELTVASKGRSEIIDLSDRLNGVLAESGLGHGQMLCFVRHSTAALTTIEFEPGLIADMKALFERLAPAAGEYEHHKRWGDFNGHSHLLASLFGPSLTIPIMDGRLVLGTWQQPVLLDFDVTGRQRTVVVQITGE